MHTTTETTFRRGDRVRVVAGKELTRTGRVVYPFADDRGRAAYVVELDRSFKRLRLLAGSVERLPPERR